MTVLLPACLAAVGAVLIAVAGAAGAWIVTAAALLCVLALATGWSDLLALPDRSGSGVVVGLVGAVALVAGTEAVAPGAPVSRPPALFATVTAATVLISFAHELLRRDGRHDLVESVTGTLTGQLVAVLATGWVLLFRESHGPSAIVVAVAAIAVSRIADALPLYLPLYSEQVRPWAAIGAGLVAALVAGVLVSGVKPLSAVLSGLAGYAAGVAVDRLFPSPEEHFEPGLLARAAAPLAAAGTVAFAVFQLAIT